MKPQISIIMPTYNSARFIEDSLDSLIRQTNQNFELIVCDGGSTDETLRIIKGKMKEMARIVSLKDNGIPDALNKGFYAAKGDVFCWLNSDDVLLSRDALKHVQTAFFKKKEDIVIGDCAVLNLDGLVTKTLISFGPARKYPASSGNVFTGSLFFSRKVWEYFGGFSGQFRLAFEYELTDAIFRGFNVKHMPYLIGGFRVHESGLSSRYHEEMEKEKNILRKDIPPMPRMSYLMNRFVRHVFDFTLLRVIENSFLDSNQGIFWGNLDEHGRVKMGFDL